MKKFFCILMICALCIGVLAGCDRATSVAPAAQEEAQQVVNFAPETTAVASEETILEDAPAATDVPVDEQPVAQDSAATTEAAQEAASDAPAQAPADQPFAPTPQPNARIDGYSQVTDTGLGFRFSYPTGWNNIPGRSTVCYVQPLENGTVYPARVAVTMKQLAHKPKQETIKEELVAYLKLLMSQYDERTFEVDESLDTSTKFMGNSAMSTTYLAYDGNQEIQGYVIITSFEKYLFCYHFLCAYEDYPAFETAMRAMRDSVQAEKMPGAD